MYGIYNSYISPLHVPYISIVFHFIIIVFHYLNPSYYDMKWIWCNPPTNFVKRIILGKVCKWMVCWRSPWSPNSKGIILATIRWNKPIFGCHSKTTLQQRMLAWWKRNPRDAKQNRNFGRREQEHKWLRRKNEWTSS